MTGSWDKTLRLWRGLPNPKNHKHASGVSQAASTTEDGAGSTYISNYEKAHPLELPKALGQVRRGLRPVIMPLQHVCRSLSQH